jgi:hypothetical protein
MCIGNWLFVEFSMTGNACYGFPISKGAVELGKKVYALVDLKQRAKGNRWLVHKDGKQPWEETFFEELKAVNIEPDVPRARMRSAAAPRAASKTPIRTSRPSKEPAHGAAWAADADRLVTKLRERGIEVSDRRVVGGTVWVLDANVGEWEETLRRIGMKYKQGKGFYL